MNLTELYDIAISAGSHTHNTSDYWISGTWVACNPRGYVSEPNLDFKPC